MSYVYLIQDWSSEIPKYKIGITKNSVEERLKSLQTGSSGELVISRIYESENYRKIESWLHKKYKYKSTDGGKEWFYLEDKDVLNFINICKKVDDNINLLKEQNPFYK